jgi:hypothetical protein
MQWSTDALMLVNFRGEQGKPAEDMGPLRSAVRVIRYPQKPISA